MLSNELRGQHNKPIHGKVYLVLHVVLAPIFKVVIDN